MYYKLRKEENMFGNRIIQSDEKETHFTLQLDSRSVLVKFRKKNFICYLL